MIIENSHIDLWLPGVLFLLYAEIHYRIPLVPSRLFKRMPEVILDVPHRLAPGATLPVLVLIKDAQRFPIVLHQLETSFLSGGAVLATQTTGFSNEPVSDGAWHRIIEVEPPHGMHGAVEVACRLFISRDGVTQVIDNDNYVKTSHRPFSVYCDAQPLPGADRCHYGDLHYHSHLTSDQVEFGAHPQVAARMAQAMGLDFFAVTDHSYDLDDHWEDYLHNHPATPKWHYLQNLVRTWNAHHAAPLMIAGEEVSAGNHRGHNIHFLVINHPDYLPGHGDSAEKWLRTTPQLSIPQILDQLAPHALAFAAHPAKHPPFMERLLFGRDRWHPEDLRDDRLTGLQFWNGLDDADMEDGRKQWIDLLLAQQRPVLIAGNDAHGHFGRCRQISIPFFSMHEKETQLFGQVRTGVLKTSHRPTLDKLLQALKKGRCLVSSGPFAEMKIKTAEGADAVLGDATKSKAVTVAVRACSSTAYGPIQSAALFVGDHAQKKETRISLFTGASDLVEMTYPLSQVPSSGYIRLEVSSRRAGQIFRCLTNPIFFEPDDSAKI